MSCCSTYPQGIGWFVFALLLAAGIIAAHPMQADERRFLLKASIPALALLR